MAVTGVSDTNFVEQIKYIDREAFDDDVTWIEQRWRRRSIGAIDLPVIDLGENDQARPLIFVPVLEQLEFMYARQMRFFCQSRRTILYRRHESRTHFINRLARVEELRQVLDALNITSADFVGHGDAAMVVFEFALRYPERCHSLIIVAQGADYQIAPHPWIWILHELFLRLPVDRIIPASWLRRIVLRYISHTQSEQRGIARSVPRLKLPDQYIAEQLAKIALWPSVYRYSVLPVIHNFDIRDRLHFLDMPVLLINRMDDILSPLEKTSWLAEKLDPHCVYHLLEGTDRFFLYAQAEIINPLIAVFLERKQMGKTIDPARSASLRK